MVLLSFLESTKDQSDTFRVWRVIILLMRAKCFGLARVKGISERIVLLKKLILVRRQKIIAILIVILKVKIKLRGHP